MASEMEQTLDEILSGVESLLANAPASSVDVRAAPLPESAWSAGDRDPIRADQSMVLAAVLEAQHEHPASRSARRWLVQEFGSRAQPLGPLGGARFAGLRISPRVFPCAEALTRQGATLVECDAFSMTWSWPAGTRYAVRQIFGRLISTVCLDQDGDGLQIRIPQMPERLGIRAGKGGDLLSSHGAAHLQQFALIDQDNLYTAPSTLFWFSDQSFVPDYLCAVTWREGRWWPVVRESAD